MTSQAKCKQREQYGQKRGHVNNQQRNGKIHEQVQVPTSKLFCCMRSGHESHPSKESQHPTYKQTQRNNLTKPENEYQMHG